MLALEIKLALSKIYPVMVVIVAQGLIRVTFYGKLTADEKEQVKKLINDSKIITILGRDVVTGTKVLL